ncbi:MAG TPA: zf-HC2 domain-containing protein [Myxococcales bacterium]|nr:zf-HC2 domain-containing protein [Myxococcales bacterium]
MTRRVPGELSCAELVELVTDYLEGALSADEREQVEKHLAICKGCAEYVRQMRETIAASGALHREPLSREAREKLLRAFRELCK